jgi:PAS domain S-box-containing protein
MKTGTKLTIGFAGMVILMWIAGLFIERSYAAVLNQFDVIENSLSPGIMTINEMRAEADSATREAVDYTFQGSEDARQKALSSMKHLTELGHEHLYYKSQIGEEPKAADELTAAIDKFNATLAGFTSPEAGGADLATTNMIVTEKIIPALDDFNKELSRHKAILDAELVAAKEAVSKAEYSSIWFLLIVGCLVTMVAAVVAFFITRSIVKPLNALRQGTETIAKGNLDYKVGTRARDEIGQLSRAFNQMTLSLSRSMTSINNLNREIAERQRNEGLLRASEKKYSTLVESGSDGIIIIQDGLVKFANLKMTQITGFSLEEVLNTPFIDYVCPEHRGMVAKNYQMRMLGEPTLDQYEIEIIQKDGGAIPVIISASKIDYEGEPADMAIIRDITERKQAEEELRFSDTALRSLHEGMFATDTEHRITRWNEASERIFGVKAPEAIGKYVRDVIPLVKTYPGQEEELFKALLEKGYKRNELLLRTPRGDIWVNTYAQAIKDQGKRYGYITLVEDITERKRAEANLKQALAKLEHSSARLAATNKELEAFSYSVSHDLRAPLRSIDGFSQALLEDYPDKLDKKGQDYLKRLRAASQKMGELIDSMLKLSRLTRGEINIEEVDLSALTKEIAARLQETQPERQAEFVIEEGLKAQGDPRLLRPMFENLLGNAWKFTARRQPARIEFGATRNGDQPAYFVRDNGAGFDMTYADKLFTAFQRLHDAAEFPGTGIGLATVQRIINRHGGRVWAEGAVGKGATFYFTMS